MAHGKFVICKNTVWSRVLVLCMSNLEYKVCLKSNETGAIKYFINNWTTSEHYPLQSSSCGKPHTAADIAPTPGSSARSLHVEVLSADLSQPFGCSKWWPLKWNLNYGKRNVTWTQIRRVWGLRNHWNTIFGKKFVHRGGIVTGSVVVMQHPSVCNLWPDMMNPFSALFKDLMIVPIILTVKHWSDLTRALTLVTFSFAFDVQGLQEQGLSSTLWRPSKNALCHLKTCALDRACSP